MEAPKSNQPDPARQPSLLPETETETPVAPQKPAPTIPEPEKTWEELGAINQEELRKQREEEAKERDPYWD